MSQEVTTKKDPAHIIYSLVSKSGYIADADWVDGQLKAAKIHFFLPIGYATLTQLQKLGKITFLVTQFDAKLNKYVTAMVLDLA